MAEKLTLQPGETLLFKVPVSLVTGKLATRTGVCYLTSQRVVVISEGLLAGVAAGISIIARTVLRKTKQLGTQRQEIALRQLGRVSLQKYGLNQTVDLPLGDGTMLRMVMSAKTRQRFLQALDQALAGHNLQRVPEGEAAWRIRPQG